MILAENDADFFIELLYEYHLFGQSFYLTTTHAAMLILSLALILFFLAANISVRKALARNIAEKPGGFLNAVELMVEWLDRIWEEDYRNNARGRYNYVGTLFIFTVACNISGIFGLRPPTADYGVTLCLGMITFGLIHYHGVKKRRGKHFTGLLEPFPLLFPLNLIGEAAVPLSLSLRLFGNVMSGTVMMGLWYGLMPFLFQIGIPAALHCYFDLFSGVIQAYVFCMLTVVYIQEKVR